MGRGLDIKPPELQAMLSIARPEFFRRQLRTLGYRAELCPHHHRIMDPSNVGSGRRLQNFLWWVKIRVKSSLDVFTKIVLFYVPRILSWYGERVARSAPR
jgi:hypothetical protein